MDVIARSTTTSNAVFMVRVWRRPPVHELYFFGGKLTPNEKK
jgi:hypothetical protein